ncbi:MAG TPA: F0F1 ATP synthase subunit epsilon [Clostridiales bacterium]|nr:F0F1 ATP synthase subunit epsilon [Clostridiales bacterium]
MTDKRISLEIVTPEKKIYSADVYYLHAPAMVGGIGIYPRHTPIVTALDVGELSVDSGDGKQEIFFISGGFLDVCDDKAVVLAKSAERSEDIDVVRAEKAKARAEERLANPAPDFDALRAELALKRAILRIKIAKTEK